MTNKFVPGPCPTYLGPNDRPQCGLCIHGTSAPMNHDQITTTKIVCAKHKGQYHMNGVCDDFDAPPPRPVCKE